MSQEHLSCFYVPHTCTAHACEGSCLRCFRSPFPQDQCCPWDCLWQEDPASSESLSAHRLAKTNVVCVRIGCGGKRHGPCLPAAALEEMWGGGGSPLKVNRQDPARTRCVAETSHVLGTRASERRESRGRGREGTEGLSLGSESWVQAGSWWERLPGLFDQTGQGGGWPHCPEHGPPGHGSLLKDQDPEPFLQRASGGP